MDTLWRDLRYAVRVLLKKRGFTAVAVLSLALGIGANTAIFSVVSAVLLRALPFHEPERLVIVWEDASFAGFPQNTPAPANYVDWKAQNDLFEDMAALRERTFNLTGDAEPERFMAHAVTANLFPLLGVEPAVGRYFLPEEDIRAANVVVLSYGLWQRRFGGRADIVDQDILLDGQSRRVIGVMPRGFQFLDDSIALWTPLGLTAEELASRSVALPDRHRRARSPACRWPGSDRYRNRSWRASRATIRTQPATSVHSVLPLHEQLTGAVPHAADHVAGRSGSSCSHLLQQRGQPVPVTRDDATSRNRDAHVARSEPLEIVRQLLIESFLVAGAGGAFGVGARLVELRDS